MQFRPSICLFVCHWQVGALRKRREAGLRLLCGAPMTTSSPKLEAHNPQSKLASQIATECFFVMTAYGNIPPPYPTLPSSTPYRYSFPKSSQKLNSKLLQNGNRFPRTLYTRPVKTHWRPVTTNAHPIVASLPPNFEKAKLIAKLRQTVALS